MKVLIITEGGTTIGLGHISRCTAIGQAFKEHGVVPELKVCGDDWQRESDKMLKIAKEADIVLVDSYQAPQQFYEEVSRIARMPVYLDDYMRIRYPKGIVVNGAIFAEGMNYPARRDVEYLLGAHYFPLRKAFWDAPSLQIRKHIERILITFGGADSAGMTPAILRCLAHHLPKTNKTVIIGKWFRNIAGIKKCGDHNTKYMMSPDADGMRQVMLASDLAISSGGQTLYELARVGLPTIAISEADNQIHNLRGWARTGFISFTDKQMGPAPEKIVLTGLEQLQNRRVRTAKNHLGRKFIDGNGAHRIVAKLLNSRRLQLT